MNNYSAIKYAAVCLSLSVAASCSTWAPSPSPEMDMNLDRYDLKGDVASVRNIVYDVDSSEDGYVASSVAASTSNIYLEFDDNGRVTFMERFNKSGEPVSEMRIQYGSNGRVSDSKLVSADGKILESSVYKYRRGGRLQSMTVKDGNDSLKKHEEYDYFGRDSIKALFTFKEGEEPSGYRIMKYDSEGRNTEAVTYSSKGKQFSEFVIRYDSLGRRKSVDSKSLLFGSMVTEMDYNEDGFCSGMRFSGENRPEMQVRFTFKTDSCGNWTEKVTYHDDVPTKLEKREITYRH